MQGAIQSRDTNSFSWLMTFLSLELECDFSIIEGIYIARQPLDFADVLAKLPNKIDLTLPQSMDLLADAFRACNWPILFKNHCPSVSSSSVEAWRKTEKIIFNIWPFAECGPRGGFFFQESNGTSEISISFQFNNQFTSLWFREGFSVGENILDLPTTLPQADILLIAHQLLENKHIL